MTRYAPMELAESFMRTGELDDALEALNQQLVAQPNDDEAHRLRSQIFARQKRFDEAIADMQHLQHPQASDYVAWSIVAEQRDQMPEAIAKVLVAQSLSPHDERIQERLVYLYWSQAQYDLAYQVVQAQPKTWRWLQYAADIVAQQGDHTQAIDIYTQVIAQLDELLKTLLERQLFLVMKSRVLVKRAENYLELRDYAQAKRDYTQAKRYVNDPTIEFNLGVIEALQGNWDEAISVCRLALRRTTKRLRQDLLASLTDEALAPLAQKLQDDFNT
jgi:tetratricopeptide (TPR) repeat protein